MTLGEKLSLIQQEFKAKKSRFNAFGKYNFRSAEDILEGLKPFNSKYKVYFTIREDVQGFADGGTPIIVSTATAHDCESDTTIKATAVVGVDLAQKGMQKPQAFGSASSYGKKYALGNLLLIDDTADADATNGHNKGTTAKTPTGSPVKNEDSFQQSVDYLNASPDDKKGAVLQMILDKYGSKFSAPQVAALKKLM
jgi:hypothetical protein